MFRRRLPVIGLLVLASLAATARRSSAQPLLGEYAVLGLQRTVLRPGARVTAGAVGTAGGTLVLRNHVRIGGTVAADMIRLDNDATASRFFCRFVVLSHGGGAVGGPVVGGGALPGCRAFTPPLVDPTLLAPVAVVPGGTDVRVRPFSGTAPLPAASLRDVVVGRGALLQLAGGSYTARSIRIAPNGRLVCIDACRIGVLERIVLAPRAPPTPLCEACPARRRLAASPLRRHPPSERCAPGAYPHAALALPAAARQSRVVLSLHARVWLRPET